MITSYDSLDISPEEGKFFHQHEFYSHLKDDIMTEEEYDNVKKFYQIMRLKDLGELNKICNFQDTIILCEIFEQRSERLQQLFKYNPQKFNSASSISGCAHRGQSKCLIALPTELETLIGGFGCVNTRLAFDTQILLNDKQNKKVVFDLLINTKKNKQEEYLQLY